MRHLRRWGAVYLLLLLFVGSWAGQFVTMMSDARQEQAMHHQPFVMSDFVVQFWASTLENWQSEWLQLIFQAILLLGAKHWIFRVDAEDMERVEAKIDAIQARLERSRPAAPAPEPVHTGAATGPTEPERSDADRLVDEVGEDTFPASDPPPMWTGDPSGLSGSG